MKRNQLRSIPPVIGLLLAALLVTAVSALADDGTDQASRIDVGQEAPEVVLSTPDGTTLRSTDLRGEKNLVLVFFRGTW